MREMKLDSIRASVMSYQRVVLLKDANSSPERYLFIWIGPNEADAIAHKLHGARIPRPLSHDLMLSFIETLGAEVSYILINDMKENTYFAKIGLTVGGREVEVDARPSDAINLAVRAQAPIYAEEEVLDNHAIYLDARTGKASKPDGAEDATDRERVGKEELQDMSAFVPFINTLDLEDFGKKEASKG